MHEQLEMLKSGYAELAEYPQKLNVEFKRLAQLVEKVFRAKLEIKSSWIKATLGFINQCTEVKERRRDALSNLLIKVQAK